MWIHGRMGRHRENDGSVDGRLVVDRLTYRCVNGWMGRQTDGQIDG